MTEEVFNTQFAILHQEYSYELRDLPPKAIAIKKEMWFGEFKNLTDEQFTWLVTQHIRRSKFFPKVSDLYDLLLDIKIPKIDPDTEFDKAIKVIKNNPIRKLEYTCPITGDFKAHITTLDDVLGKLSPQVAKAVRSVGIARIMDINNRVWVKKEFAEALNDERSRQLDTNLKHGLGMNSNGGIEHEQSDNRRIG